MKVKVKILRKRNYIAFIVTLFFSLSAMAEPMSKEQGDQILKELRELKELIIQSRLPLNRMPKNKVKKTKQGGRQLKQSANKLNNHKSNYTIPLQYTYKIGADSAPVTLVEFIDYNCHFCKKFYNDSLPKLKSEYIDKGLLNVIIKDFPRSDNPKHLSTFQAVHCADNQGKFLEMHNRMLQYPSELSLNVLFKIAKGINLEESDFTKCMKQPEYLLALKKSVIDSKNIGIQATPSFIIGKQKDKETFQGYKVRGAQPVFVFQQKIDQLLKEL